MSDEDFSETGPAPGALLVIDTCGERGSVALFWGERMQAEEVLPERMAAAALLPAVRAVLAGAGMGVHDLGAVGVVNGPGSFTGVRVGLAVGKGICEGRGLALATVSKLAVLADAGSLRDGFAVLRAGRDQLYVREKASRSEGMLQVEEFLSLARGKEAVCAEPDVASTLGEELMARVVAISAKDAGSLVRRALLEGGGAPALADANYLRDERTIFRRAGARPIATGGLQGEAPR